MNRAWQKTKDLIARTVAYIHVTCYSFCFFIILSPNFIVKSQNYLFLAF